MAGRRRETDMSSEHKNNLATLIEELASGFVLLGAGSREDLGRFIEGLKKARDVAREQSFDVFAEATELMLTFLENIPDAEISKKSEMLSFVLSALQHLLSAKPESQSDIFQKIKKQLERLAASFAGTEESSDIRPDEIQVFIGTAGDGLAAVENAILELEQAPKDKNKILDIFRIFHTIKGEASLLGFNNIVALAHAIEDLLEGYKEVEREVGNEVLAVVLSAADLLNEIVVILREDVARALAVDISALTEKAAALAGPKADAGAAAARERRQDFVPSVPTLDLSEGTAILTEFIMESKDHLASAEESLLTLENTPDNAGEINKIFREFHTIKGLASFLNLDDIRTLSHDTENMMDLVRRGTLALTPEVAGIIFAAIDAARKLFDLLQEQVVNSGVLTSPYHDISSAIAAIRDMQERAEAGEEPKPAQKPKIGEILVKKEIITEEDLGSALEHQEEVGGEKKLGEIFVETGMATASQVERGLEEQKKRAGIEDAIRISVKKLDDLIDTTGELVIAASQVAQNSDILASQSAKLIEDVSQLGGIIRNIQGTVMSMRLVPIRPLFQKMLRLARDLSRKLGKEVDMRLDGEDTEIDKNIIDCIADPLVHLVRNAIDHGIEPPGVRQARGKPPCGRIDLSAAHKGSNIIIEIKDDGAGIDREKIMAKARERGLIKNGETWEDKEILNLIFEAGFSTVENVTEISGRGVGMDVVKKNVTQLRGKVDMESRLGEGTSVVLHLPLTLAIIDGITLALGQERYIIPIFAVTEFIKPEKKNISTIQGRGEMINIHDTLYVLIRLNTYFGGRYRSDNVENLVGCVVDSDAGRACILFDELIAQQQVVIKSLGDRLKDIRGLAGATILGDGKVGLILDVNSIVAIAQGE